MSPTPADQRALNQALRKVSKLADAAEDARDTDAIKTALWKVRGAVIDAYELAKAVEENTRNAAVREVETRLELMVGMPMESL